MAREYRYAALTSSGKGYWVVYVGEYNQSQEEVRVAAVEELGRVAAKVSPYPGFNTTSTWLDRLVVVSVSAAKRAFPEAWRNYEYVEQVGMPH